ncbi:hypothetical protein ABID92_002564 [Frigoribacterium sp. PvP120]|uniref:hypothetical protein n=1 Tax=unclassified Frigoribacterium TaxID=2627005 RepID=UPI001AE8BF20|nr:hypothetical protein [Frigoribacterium sp. PvP121]MBP1240476.1 hypothetical protein [Frigoribacterium sp. PvP121]
MKRLHYVEGHVVTGDDIAEAVVAYARALALRGRSDSVDLPGIDVDGEERRFQLLLGPSSQMLVSHEPWHGDELTDAELVADVGRRGLLISGPDPVTTPSGGSPVALVPLEADEFTPVEISSPES